MSEYKFGFYTEPSQMVPLVIDGSLPVFQPIIGLAHELSEASARLDHRVRFDLKPESSHLILHAFVMGGFDRGEAPRLTGLAERTARDVLGKLLDEGFLRSDSPKGKVRIGFPMHALGSLFPTLYPAGDMDIRNDAPPRGERR